MKRTARVALGGVLGALSLVCLLLTVFPFATYALPAVASVFLIPVVIECGRKWGLAVYVAVSLAALFITPDLEAKALFIAFFGYYPVLKSKAEAVFSRIIEWIVKLAVFNAAVVASYFVLFRLGLSAEEFAIAGTDLPLKAVLLLFLLAGNLIFVLYDITLSRLLPLYFSRLQPRIRRLFKG